MYAYIMTRIFDSLKFKAPQKSKVLVYLSHSGKKNG